MTSVRTVRGDRCISVRGLYTEPKNANDGVQADTAKL